MSIKIKISREGILVDEIERAELLKQALKGYVIDTDHYWTEGMAEWRPVREIIEVLAAESAEPNLKSGDRKRSSMIATTAGEIAGFVITDYKGIAHGVVVRTPDGLQHWGAELRAKTIGGKQHELAKVCEKTRSEALDLMLKQAKGLGANAVIGVNYSTSPVDQYSHEVFCFGTAVIIEPEKR
jgi:uncharacterized protein YbjQ (UPF0145 family)